MKNAKANELAEKIIAEVESKGDSSEKVIPMLKELREMVRMEDDPLVYRAIRMAYEHLEANDGWNFQTLEDSEDAIENLTYFITLFIKSDNKYNRDEMREIANNLARA